MTRGQPREEISNMNQTAPACSAMLQAEVDVGPEWHMALWSQEVRVYTWFVMRGLPYEVVETCPMDKLCSFSLLLLRMARLRLRTF